MNKKPRTKKLVSQIIVYFTSRQHKKIASIAQSYGLKRSPFMRELTLAFIRPIKKW